MQRKKPFGRLKMYIFANALKNIGRNKGRNILIGTIIFAIITVSIISLCINNTTKSIIDDYKTRFGSEVTIAPDMSKAMSINDIKSEQKPQIKRITTQQYLDFANSQYLKESVITATSNVAGDGIKAIDEDENPKTVVGGFSIGGSSTPIGDDYITPTMSLLGNQWDEFNSGLRKLMDGGEMPENEDECIISKELAELNNLEVGDSFKLKTSVISMEDDKQVVKNTTVELKITGIYLDTTEEYSSPFKISTLNRRNEVLTNIETLIKNLGNMFTVNAKYYLKDPSLLKDFEAELRTQGLDEYYLVSTDEAGYQKVVGPVEGLKKISLTFLIVVLVFGAVILILLSSIAIRERKYEIGVLRAMGMKKRKVALGLWSEMLMITVCCLIVGFSVGSALAQPVSDMLLSEQIESAKAVEQNGPSLQGAKLVGGPQAKELVPLEEVDVSAGTDTIIEIALLALLLASIASIAAITKVTKYEPIKILMERN